MGKQEKNVVKAEDAVASVQPQTSEPSETPAAVGLEQILDERHAGTDQAPVADAPAPANEAEKPKWKFVKLYCPAEVLRFEDGSTFQFRLIRRNDGTGFSGNSFVVTEDETLANNLREAAKNRCSGVVEVKV